MIQLSVPQADHVTIYRQLRVPDGVLDRAVIEFARALRT